VQFLALSFDMEGLMRTLAECERRGLDIGPPLRQFGREKRRDVAEIIKAARGFPPHAPSTIAFYERQAAGDKTFTLRGTVRKRKLAQLDLERKKLKGLEAWAHKKYGGRLPSVVQRKLDNFDKKMRRIEAESQRRREYAVTQAGQVGSEHALGDQNTVEVRIVEEKGRKRARITTPGYNPDANVAFPRHLRKLGASYQVPVKAVTSVGNHYRVQPTQIVRGDRGAAGSKGGAVPPILGRVPQTLYYKVIRIGKKFLLVWGSRWRKDGMHNKGNSHVPKREHVMLTGDDVNRLTQILVSYGIAPLRGAART